MADLKSEIRDLDPHFTFLFNRLKENYDDYSRYVFTTTSTILLVIGWLLTSKESRAYVTEHLWMRWPMTGAIILFWAAEIWFSYRAFATSSKIVNLIDAVRKDNVSKAIPKEFYSAKATPLGGAIIFVTAHAVLYVVLILVIWSLSPPSR